MRPEREGDKCKHTEATFLLPSYENRQRMNFRYVFFLIYFLVVCGVLYNMAWTSGRAPLKQWKWLTVVSPPAARHTPQLIWHCFKHSSQARAQSSRISITHHKAGNLPALFCPNLCLWAAGQWTTRDTNVSFDSPLFSVCRVWAWLWLWPGARRWRGQFTFNFNKTRRILQNAWEVKPSEK